MAEDFLSTFSSGKPGSFLDSFEAPSKRVLPSSPTTPKKSFLEETEDRAAERAGLLAERFRNTTSSAAIEAVQKSERSKTVFQHEVPPELFLTGESEVGDLFRRQELALRLRGDDRLSAWASKEPVNAVIYREHGAEITTLGSLFNSLLRGGHGAFSGGGHALKVLQAERELRKRENLLADADRSFGEIQSEVNKEALEDSSVRSGAEEGTLRATVDDVTAFYKRNIDYYFVAPFEIVGRYARSRMARAGLFEVPSEEMLDSWRSVVERAELGRQADAKRRAEWFPQSRAALEGYRRYEDMTEGLEGTEKWKALGRFLYEHPGEATALAGDAVVESLAPVVSGAAVTFLSRSRAAGFGVMTTLNAARMTDASLSEVAAGMGYDLSKEGDLKRLLSDPDARRLWQDRAFAYAAVVATVDMASGGVASTQLAKSVAGELFLQGLTQAAMGSGGEVLGRLASGQELDPLEIALEGLAEVMLAPIEVFGVGGQAVTSAVRAKVAEKNARQFFEALAAASSDSQLRTQVPTKYREIVSELTKNGPVETIEIDSSALPEMFQNGTLTPADLAATFPSLTESGILKAIEEGHDITIPTSDYAAFAAGKPVDGVLREHMRIGGSLTTAEAKALDDDVLMQEFRQRIDDLSAGTAKLEATVEDAVIDLRSQIEAAGMSRSVADVQAKQIVTMAAVMADRIGMPFDQFVRKYPLPRVFGADADANMSLAVDDLQRLRASGSPEARVVEAAAQAAGLDDDASNEELAEALRDFAALTDEGDITLQQSVALRSGAEDLAAFGLKPGKKVKTADLAKALAARTRAIHGEVDRKDRSAESVEKIAEMMAEEAYFEVTEIPEDQSARGWYSEKFQSALDTLGSSMFPEFLSDREVKASALPGVTMLRTMKNARSFFTALVAITSDGETAARNLKHATELYASFRQSGVIPRPKGGRETSLTINAEVLTRLLAEKGPSGMHTYMLRRATVQEVRAELRKEGVDKPLPNMAGDMEVPYATALLGAKLGSFYANLMGDHGYLTMDRWWTRTFNRLRGDVELKPTAPGLANFKRLAGRTDMTDDMALELAVEIDRDYQRKRKQALKDEGIKAAKAMDAKKTKLQKVAGTLSKTVTELQDSPLGATDRKFMVDVAEKVVDKLAKRGIDMTVADMQAVMWYYEKRLYGLLGARPTEDISYEEVAKRVAAERLASEIDRPGRQLGQGPVGEPEAGRDRTPVGEEDLGKIDEAFFQRPGWAILTADDFSLPDVIRAGRNAENKERLRKELEDRGISYREVEGHYGTPEPEQSFVVIASEKTAMALGKKFGQDSVLTNSGLVYTTRVRPDTPPTGRVLFGQEAVDQGFYSVLDDGTALAVELDFSKGPGAVNLLPGYVEVVGRPQLPVRLSDGKVELFHWSGQELDTVDPKKAGTGPSTSTVRKQGLKTTFWGVNPRPNQRAPGTGYVKESQLGEFQHMALVDPMALYPWFEDPDGLRPEDAGQTVDQRKLDYEAAIKSAGYLGYYVTEDGDGRAPLGNVAVVFKALPVEPVVTISNDATLYIDTPKGSDMLPMSVIRPTRRRDKGVADAKAYMARAARGEARKRRPLTVRRDPDGRYSLLDGNSTYAVLQEAGAREVPVEIVTDEEFAQGNASRAMELVMRAGRGEKRRIALSSLSKAETATFENLIRRQQKLSDVDEALARGKENQEILASALTEAGEAIGLDVRVPPMKTKARLVPKVERKGGDVNLITDIVRAGAVVGTPAEADALLDKLAEQFFVIDEGWKTTPEGYFDAKALVVMPDGQLAEIQMWPPGMYDAKEFRGGHKLYEQMQAALDSGDAETASQMGEQMVSFYRAEVLDKLDAAWSDLTAASNSGSVTSADANLSSASVAKRALSDKGLKLTPSSEISILPEDQRYNAPSYTANFTGEPPVSGGSTIVEAGTRNVKRMEQAKRGSIILPPAGQDRAPLVTLFRTADLSTLSHESAHYLLHTMERVIQEGDAPAGMVEDFDKLKDWWKSNAADIAKEAGVTENQIGQYLDSGTTGDAAVDDKVFTGIHEWFARGFEAYLFEGRAPSSALRRMFETLSAWLLQVYRSIRNLNVVLDDEVRGVFDRLLATEEEIEKARASSGQTGLIARSAEELGVTTAEYEVLLRLQQEAHDEAKREIMREIMLPLKQARDEEYKAKRDEVEKKVRAEIAARPAHRVREWLGNGRWIGEAAPEELPTDLQMDRQMLIDDYGVEVLSSLPRGRHPLWKTGTEVSADEVAGWFGYESGDAMIKDLQSAPKFEAEVKRATAEKMREEFPDPLADGSIADTAVKAINGEARGRLLAAELRHLSKAASKSVPRTTQSQLREIARRQVAMMPVRQAIRSGVYRQAMERAGDRAQKALAAGDFDTAYDEKRKQLLNHALFMESRKAEELVGKVERRVNRLKRRGTRKNIDAAHLRAIDELLDRYDFRKITAVSERRRGALLAYVQKMQDEHRENELAIPEHVLREAQRRPYKTLTTRELEGVSDALTNIEHTGRRWKKLDDAKARRDHDEVISELVSKDNVKDKPGSRTGSRSERIRAGAREFFDLVLNADTLLRKLDGWDRGSWYDIIKAPIDAAATAEQVMRVEAADAIEKLYSVFTQREIRRMGVKKARPELRTTNDQKASFSQWELISMALNMGNADNLDRLMDRDNGYGYTKAQIDFVKDQLSEREWRFVQSVWDYLDSYWPLISEREQRLTGVAPKRVEAAEVETPFGKLKGGYYPIKYDPRLRSKSLVDEIAEVQMNMQAGRFGKAQTRDGHTKERTTGSGGRVLQLGMEVFHQHVAQVIHDITFSEPINDSWKVLQDPRIVSYFERKGLIPDHQALELWLQDVATGPMVGGGVFGRTSVRLKNTFTLSKLAFNLSTVLIQMTGITQSMVQIGKVNFAKGAIQYVSNMPGWVEQVKDASPFMAERETTFHRDIYDLLGDVTKSPLDSNFARWSRGVGTIGLWLMQKVQFYGVDMPTWLGAYQQGIDKYKGDNTKAIAFADRAVARAQASGVLSDRSAIERGTISRDTRMNGFVRLFTALGSYMFAKGNVAAERVGKARRDITGVNAQSFGAAVSAAFDLTLLFTLEAVLYNLIKGTLPGMGDDDDDEALATFLAKETVFSIMGTIPVARDIASPLQGFGGGGAYGSISETVAKPFIQAAQGEVDMALLRAVSNGIGLATGLPSGQWNRIMDAWYREAQGDDVAPIEYLMGRRD